MEKNNIVIYEIIQEHRLLSLYALKFGWPCSDLFRGYMGQKMFSGPFSALDDSFKSV